MLWRNGGIGGFGGCGFGDEDGFIIYGRETGDLWIYVRVLVGEGKLSKVGDTKYFPYHINTDLQLQC